ncbi:MAG: hypothetical protein LBD71_03320 [Treponema sp.]|jgi:hypothetical protein|nr:hypothetical protein [Treponema sp.]
MFYRMKERQKALCIIFLSLVLPLFVISGDILRLGHGWFGLQDAGEADAVLKPPPGAGGFFPALSPAGLFSDRDYPDMRLFLFLLLLLPLLRGSVSGAFFIWFSGGLHKKRFFGVPVMAVFLGGRGPPLP